MYDKTRLISKKTFALFFLTTLVVVLPGTTYAVESQLWRQFVEAKKNGTQPTLPDFSYAGYNYSETPKPDLSTWKVFKVDDFGAAPNDDVYDDTAIQDAIRAAEAHEGGSIVEFSAGEYRVSPNENLDEIITIRGSNIVLRGAGNGEDLQNNTQIFMVNKKVHITTKMFLIQPEEKKQPLLTRVTQDAERESFNITVADTSKLKVGQKIVLHVDSVDLAIRHYAPLELHEEWKLVNEKGLQLREIHTIAAIEGNDLRFREPLHISIRGEHNVQVRGITMLENVGIEHIRFKGNWDSFDEEFVHHKNDIHNYAWNAVQVFNVNNGWVHRVTFKDWNQSLHIKQSSAMTVSYVEFIGKLGHTAMTVGTSYGILFKDGLDTSGHRHGAGVGFRTTGTVYLRHTMKKGQYVDSHATGPYANLYDNVKNGNFNFNGGDNPPHHGRYLVAWNHYIDGGPDKYIFWPTNGHGRTIFALPYFVGLRGQSENGKVIKFREGNTAANEFQGQVVEPLSLFEAQLGLRLLPGYKYCCDGSGSKTFSKRVDIAYGAEGKYNFLYDVSGTVDLSDSTFGDPVSGVKKSVYVRDAAPAGYFLAGSENETLEINSLVNVAYGADGRFVYVYNRSAPMACSSSAFDEDPAPGIVKACYIQKISTPSGYERATNEGGTVVVGPNVDVAFGADGQYIFKLNQSFNIACTRAAFGGDPKPGVAKKCYTRLAANTPKNTPIGNGSAAVESQLWEQFKRAKLEGSETTLPDFSYAGYNYSNTPLPDTSTWDVFNVGDYGAIPNDDIYDDDAIKAAINAARRNGNGVVQFEAGRYMISPTDSIERDAIIRIQGSNILMKGKGSGENGTEIFMDKMKVGADMFHVAPTSFGITEITEVTDDARRESFTIRVKDASDLKVGQFITLRVDSPVLATQYYSPQIVSDTWTRLRDEGFRLKENHTVAAVNGNTVTLAEPLHLSISGADKVRVITNAMLENIGVEDILFKGNWNNYPEEFVHHKDRIHDYGWNALRLQRVRNAWIRDVEFKDWNQAVHIRESIAVTAQNLKFTGKRGHLAIHSRSSYGVLIKDCSDFANHHHGPSMGDFGSGTVYLRYKMNSGQRMDAHSGSPYATLFDAVQGGHFWGNGGDQVNFPHHGKYFVAWNFVIDGGPDSYDFWPSSGKNPHVIAMPFFAGLQGKSVTMTDGTFSVNESPGQAVKPASLFEAQLNLRLGVDPGSSSSSSSSSSSASSSSASSASSSASSASSAASSSGGSTKPENGGGGGGRVDLWFLALMMMALGYRVIWRKQKTVI